MNRRTAAGDRWRHMQDAARGQVMRLGDAEWSQPTDSYADRVESFRAGARTDQDVVDYLALAVGEAGTALEIGAGAGRLALPLARRVREVVALEPSLAMASALEADARSAGIRNLRAERGRWEERDDLTGDLAFAAHVVYSLPDIEGFVARVQEFAAERCAIILFAEPPQSRLFDFWPAVFGEPRLPNPHLPQLLEVLWSLFVYPDVTMLDVPMWPLGPFERARNGLRRRLHLVPGSASDIRLASAMEALLTDWGGGSLGPLDRGPLKLAIVSWRPNA